MVNTTLSNIKTRRPDMNPLKVTTGLTFGVDPGWKLARVFVFGEKEPAKRDAVRWVKAKHNYQFANVLQSYISHEIYHAIRRSEACVIAPPGVDVDPNNDRLIQHVKSQSMEMAWGCYALQTSEKTPSVFVISMGVIPHILHDMGPEVTISSDWPKWLHTWLTKFMLPHRYFDATQLGLISVRHPEWGEAPQGMAANEQARKAMLEDLIKLSGVPIPEFANALKTGDLPVMDAYSLIDPPNPVKGQETPTDAIPAPKKKPGRPKKT